MDVEKTIEFILDMQARLQTTLAEQQATLSQQRALIAEQRAEHEAAFAEMRAAGRRTDARLDRAIRLGVVELRRQRVRDEQLRRKVDKLAETVDRYIQSRGNGHNGN